MALVASVTIVSACSPSPATTASRTQWRTCSSSRPMRHALQRLGGRRHLGEDVDAVHVLVDHPLQTSDLSFDPAQTLEVVVLVLAVAVHVGSFGHDGRKRRSRRLLVTTKTLENAIAAPANIGLSIAAAANGMAATL